MLGEDLIHTRDYSHETARLIDEETEHILDTQALRARQTHEAHRDTLDAVAAALLTQETLLGDELADLVATAEADTGTAPTRLAG